MPPTRRARLHGGLEDPLDLLGSSLMPGMSGADEDARPGCPPRLSSATASIRAFGLGVCGSLARHGFSSIVGIERFAWISVTSAISRIRRGPAAAAATSSAPSTASRCRAAPPRSRA